MVERVLHEEPLARVLAEDHAVELVEVGAPLHLAPGEVPGGDGGLEPLRAILGRGMGGEPGRAGGPLPVFWLARSSTEKTSTASLRVVALAAQVAQSQVVGLPLRVAAELQEHEAHAGLGEIAELLQLGAHDHADAEAQHARTAAC